MKLDNRLWVLITVLLVAAVFAGGWFLGAAPFVQSATASLAQTASVVQQNGATQQQLVTLKATKAKMAGLTQELASLRRAVPNSIDGSTFIADVNRIAGDSGVSVTAIKLGAPTAYAAPPAPASATPDAAASGAGSTPAPTASATPAPTASAPAPSAAPPTTVDPTITAANFVIVDTSIDVTGPRDAVNAFLAGLQRGSRLVLVTKLSSVAGEKDVQLSITGNIYVVRDPSAAADG